MEGLARGARQGTVVRAGAIQLSPFPGHLCTCEARVEGKGAAGRGHGREASETWVGTRRKPVPRCTFDLFSAGFSLSATGGILPDLPLICLCSTALSHITQHQVPILENREAEPSSPGVWPIVSASASQIHAKKTQQKKTSDTLLLKESKTFLPFSWDGTRSSLHNDVVFLSDNVVHTVTAICYAIQLKKVSNLLKWLAVFA